MKSVLAKSWSAMCCRGLTATPSVKLLETLAMFRTSGILYSRGAASRLFMWQMTSNFLGVPFCTDFGVGDV